MPIKIVTQIMLKVADRLKKEQLITADERMKLRHLIEKADKD